MPTWIRFRHDNGNSTLINAEDVLLSFKAEEPYRIEVQALHAAQTEKSKPLLVYTCEHMEQVYAAEDLIFEALSQQHSVTLTLDGLEEHAEHLNHVDSIRMVLNLIHHGSIRIPVSYDYPQGEELFLSEEDPDNPSQIRQLEQILHTYLDAPEDCLRRAYKRPEAIKSEHPVEDCPFKVVWDHEECEDHGFHEHWQVFTLPDRDYRFREAYQALTQSVADKEGFQLKETSKGGIFLAPQLKTQIS